MVTMATAPGPGLCKTTWIKQPAVSNGHQVLVPWQPFHIGSTVWYLWEGPITSERKHILHFPS